MPVVMERRRAVRFNLHLPVIVRWSQVSIVHEITTVSKDVCSRGIYFFLEQRVEPGTSVEIVLTLPHEITLADMLSVRCFGRVQRCESNVADGSNVGVAVSIEKYEFLRKD